MITKKYYSDPQVCDEDLKKTYVTDYVPFRGKASKTSEIVGSIPQPSVRDCEAKKDFLKKILT